MWNDRFQRKVRGFRGTSALSQVIDLINADQNIDYVFYDCGPTSVPLNRVILLGLPNFFIVPAACDLFSIRAL